MTSQSLGSLVGIRFRFVKSEKDEKKRGKYAERREVRSEMREEERYTLRESDAECFATLDDVQ